MNTNRTRMRASAWRLASRVAAVAAGALLTSVTACGAAAAAAPQTDAHFADSAAQASIALVQVNWSGWVVVLNTVKLSSTEYLPKGRYGPFTAVTSCSGFVVSSSGDIVTAGHCVDADSFYGGKGAILAAAAPTYAHPNSDTHLTLAEIAGWEQAMAPNVRVEGDQSGSPVDLTVEVSVPSVSAGTAVFTGWNPAKVVDVEPFTQGDVALLSAAGLATPALPVANATPTPKASIVAAGYPGSIAEVVYPTTLASFLKGTVIGTQAVNGISFSQISPQASADMSGGPVLNTAGQVVGTLSWPPSGTTSGSSMTDVGSIWSMLATNGVIIGYSQSNGLPWWAYPLIGVAALALAGVAGIFLRKRRQARAAREKQAKSVAEPAPSRSVLSAQAPSKVTASSQPGGDPPSRPTEQHAPMFCTNCGIQHAEEARYCERCGQPFPASFPAEHGGRAPSESAVLSQPVGEAPRSSGPTEQQAPMFCPNCGIRHAEQAHYCERCGQPFPPSIPAEHGEGGGIRT